MLSKFEPHAILVADMVGYSTWLAEQPLRTHRAFANHVQNVFHPTIQRHHGQSVKTTGDGIFAIFKTPEFAEQCARDIQSQITAEDDALGFAPLPTIQYRISLHSGPIIIERGDIFGIDVNIAVHMQRLAPSGGICASRAFWQELNTDVQSHYDYNGEHYLKNIPFPISIYINDTRSPLDSESAAIAHPPQPPQRSSIVVVPRIGIANLAASDSRTIAPARFVYDTLTMGLSRFRDAVSVAQMHASIDTLQPGGRSVHTYVRNELQLDYFVHGSVASIADRDVATIFLEDSKRMSTLWSHQIAVNYGDLDKLFEIITSNIVAPIVLYVQDNERRSWTLSPHSESEVLFRRAQSLMSLGTLSSLEEALRLLTGMLEQGGEVAEVLLALARAEHDRGILLGGQEFIDALERGSAHAQTAIGIDDLNARAHAELALHELKLKRSTHAIRIYEQALRLNPYDPIVSADWADCLTYAGKPDEALRILKRVLAGWPRDRAAVEWNLCDAYWALERPDKIVEILEGKPELPHVHRFLAASYVKMGRMSEAKHHADKVRLHQPGFSARTWGNVVPFSTADGAEEYVDYLERAGL